MSNKPKRSGRAVRSVGAFAIAAVVVWCSVPVPSATAATPAYGLAGIKRFSAASVFNQKIRAGARIDPGSKGMAALLAGDTSRVVNLIEFGVPVFRATSGTPRRSFSCTMDWGTCAPEAASPIRIPDHARSNNGSDGAMVVIDLVNKRSYEFWQAERTGNGNWRASWASRNDLKGTGTGSGGSGSGISRVAGMVSVAEASHPGVPLRHALAFSTKFACEGLFRYPATRTDGGVTARPCLPEGARIQLDPAVKVGKIPGITPGEAMVARALQQYGAFVVDRGGAAAAFLFERARDSTNSYPGKVYEKAGFTRDYFGLRKIPWGRIRVLKSAR